MAEPTDAINDDAVATRRSSALAAFEERHVRAPVGFYGRAWRRFRRNHVALASLVICILIIAFALGAGLISKYVTGYSESEGDIMNSFAKPFSPGHLLGTDGNGRDILTRLAYGGRISLMVAGVAAVSAIVIGGVVGSVSGYFGGFIDSILMRIVDVLLSIPGLSLLILISALYTPGPFVLALVIGGLGWTGVARLIRAEVLSLRSRDFVEAARVVGATNYRIITRHIFPSVVPTVVVWASLSIPGFILVEAALSFLGFGVQIPTPSWGNMLQDAQQYFTTSWTNVFIPGFMIYITVLVINLVGNGLRDALDPRLSD